MSVDQLELAKAFKKQLTELNPPIISRQEAAKLTGGFLSVGTLANLDSKGEGPAGKVVMGKIKVGYVTEKFAEWFLNRLNFQG